jgi:hypothetical membrane protein
MLVSILKAHPHLQGILFDRPPVCKIAKRCIDKHGMQDRIQIVEGSFFESTIPTSADVVLLSGILILVGALLLYRTKRYNPFALNLGLIGLGTAGVGMFPAFHLAIHSLSALIAFGSGGVGAIYSGYLFKPPFRYLAIILGTISLVCLGLGLGDSSLVLPLLGKGGTERWVAYPTMIWLIGLGGFLMAGKSQKS